MTYYVLDDDHNPVATPDYRTWGRFFSDIERRRVAATQITEEVSVSTVFLGMDHAFGGGRPLLFETLVFGGPDDGWMDRYSTWDEAEAGHAFVVGELTAGLRLGEESTKDGDS